MTDPTLIPPPLAEICDIPESYIKGCRAEMEALLKLIAKRMIDPPSPEDRIDNPLIRKMNTPDGKLLDMMIKAESTEKVRVHRKLEFGNPVQFLVKFGGKASIKEENNNFDLAAVRMIMLEFFSKKDK